MRLSLNKNVIQSIETKRENERKNCENKTKQNGHTTKITTVTTHLAGRKHRKDAHIYTHEHIRRTPDNC